MRTHCCSTMDQVAYVGERPDGDHLVQFIPRWDEYGLPIEDGGNSVQSIAFCPWCGKDMPPSQRGRWFDELDRLGLEPEDAPVHMRSDGWLRQNDVGSA